MTTPNTSYRTIPLTRGHVAIVDECDYDSLSAYKWYTVGPASTGVFYAATKVDGKCAYMHRIILGLTTSDRVDVDHIDHRATLDNRRSNLRVATHAQNLWNRAVQKSSSTKLKGAYPKSGRTNFFSHITVNRKVIYLGVFATPESAHAAYCEAAKKYHGEFARTQ